MRSNAVPDPVRILSVAYFLLLAVALFRAAVPGEIPPLPLPYLTALLSAACLWFLGERRERRDGFVRVGFHVGFFAFLLSLPLFDPSDIPPAEGEEVRALAGVSLLLSIVGFELGYWVMRPGPVRPLRDNYSLGPSRGKWLFLVVLLGAASWFFTTLARATSLGVSPIDLLLNVRSRVEGAKGEESASLQYVGFLSSLLYFASASAASVLLTSASRSHAIRSTVCWGVLLLAASIGFLNGSRGFFALSAMPLLATMWLLVSRSPKTRALRIPFAISGIVFVVVVWGIMSAVRGADVRRYEGGVEQFSPERHAEGALSIYAELEKVVAACPERVPYFNGDSLLPVLLGWVPRPLWPSKPYPFSASFWCASTGKPLNEMEFSIAYSLPGEAYGNFGLIGAALLCSLFGVATRVADASLGRLHPGHPLRLQLSAMAAVWIAVIVRGGVAEMFYLGLFPFAFCWAVARWLDHGRSR